jgi:CheY-like chemotaxis protein/CHASE3 domain sensor protein
MKATHRADLTLPAATLIGLVIAAVAIGVIALFTYRSLQARERAVNNYTHTFAVQQGLERLLSSLKDAETGQRGYLLTGEERYLEPYNGARTAIASELNAVQTLTAGNLPQQQRLDDVAALVTEKMDGLEQMIALRRAGNNDAALEAVRNDRGKAVMDRLRALIGEMEDDEQQRLDEGRISWESAVALSSRVTWGGSILLIALLVGAGSIMSRDYRAQASQAWLRTGQMLLGQRIQGDQRFDQLGDNALAFFGEYLDAQAGALYVGSREGSFHRVAGYALPPGSEGALVRTGDGLLGQAAKENRLLHVTDVPEGYLPVASSLGRGTPTSLIVSPAAVDGTVQAVVELGFFRTITPIDRELLVRVSEVLGVAIRAAKDRSRLEELLSETQRQAEELQAQQEELRTSNEELEEQGHVLRDSQARLETQQAELEQINSHLEEQTHLLERQKEHLSQAQGFLTDKAAELERANQYKSEFLANMSHELRTPLNSSLILAKLLADNKDGNLTPEQVKFARTIYSAGDDLLTLINDILDLSKIEAGQVDVSAESVALPALLDTIVKGFQPVADEKGLRLDLIVEQGVPASIETDPQRLGQILKNLLSNALKFTDRGEVSLRVFPQPGALVSFAVRDTGIGIPAYQQDVIFEAFRQADGSTHRKYGGTGLGLSISRDLARLLGGDIQVQSAAQMGSTFTLTLPLAFTAAPEMAAQPATAPRRVAAPSVRVEAAPAEPLPRRGEIEDDRDELTPDGRRVLVVEDDARFAMILRDLAHERGFQCVVAGTAADGFAAASTYHPHAILLDVNLPDHSGLGVLDRLKHDPATRHIPVHVLSVSDYTHEALERGAIGYALKPVKREQLIEAFRHLEAKSLQALRRVLVVEDDDRQRESIRELLANNDVQITGVKSGAEALEQLHTTTFDCMVMDLNLPGVSGYELLERMAGQEGISFPPVIVYTGRSLTRDEEQELRRFSRSIIIKDARSPERLLDEVTLFLHQMEDRLPIERQQMLKVARNREAALEGRRILVAEDDVRNIFALSSILEPLGVTVRIARNGKEAIEALTRSAAGVEERIDLVLMDIMMPEMDGLTAMREIRKRDGWKKLPVIALTAKAMKDDHEKCLAAGASDYIAKPLDVEKLLSLVRVWMPK